MKFKETKKRSILKALFWRFLAFLNSYTVLLLYQNNSSYFWPALIMNISGFILFYFYERIWNKIKYGKYKEN